MSEFRVAPALFPADAGSPPTLFRSLLPDNAPLPGPGGRVIRFPQQRYIRAYRRLFEEPAYARDRATTPITGTPFTRLPWLQDTLLNPHAVWRHPFDAPNGSDELFVSHYLVGERKVKILFVVHCRVLDETSREPRFAEPIVDPFEQWTRLEKRSTRIWCSAPTPVEPPLVPTFSIAILLAAPRMAERYQRDWTSRFKVLTGTGNKVRLKCEFVDTVPAADEFPYLMVDARAPLDARRATLEEAGKKRVPSIVARPEHIVVNASAQLVRFVDLLVCFGSSRAAQEDAWRLQFDKLEETYRLLIPADCWSYGLPCDSTSNPNQHACSYGRRHASEYWILDTNTAKFHKTMGFGFSSAARAHGARPLPVESPARLGYDPAKGTLMGT